MVTHSNVHKSMNRVIPLLQYYRISSGFVKSSSCCQWNRQMHISSCKFAINNPAQHRKHRERSAQHDDEWDRDMGEWSENNKMLYPPLSEEEGIRPAEIYHGRQKIRQSPKKLYHLALLVRNMNVDEAISKLSYINSKGSRIIQAILLEAQELAVKDHNVEFKSNLHVVKSFVARHSILHFPVYRAMGRPPAKGGCYFSNYYVMIREGPAPPASPKLTALDSALDYLQSLRNRRIADGL